VSPPDASRGSAPGQSAPGVAPDASRAARGNAWMWAGAGLVVIVGAVLAWQVGGAQRAPAPVAAAPTAPAPAMPVVTTPDVGPSIANVASVPQWGNGTAAPKPSR